MSIAYELVIIPPLCGGVLCRTSLPPRPILGWIFLKEEEQLTFLAHPPLEG